MRVEEERWQEISCTLFAPSEMAQLTTMRVEFAGLMLLSGQLAE
jgi:hypothetical protein